MGLWFIIYVYLFGGLTFIPLVIFLFVYLHPKIEDDHEIEADDEVQDSTTPYEKLRASEIDELLKSGLGAYMAGWVTVTQEYLESMNEISSNTQSISESHENKSAYLSLYKLVKNSEEEGDTLSINSSNDDAPNGTNGGTSGATNGRRLSSSSIEPVSSNTTDDNKKLRTLQRKHRFYAVLRHGNLFLYKNEKKTDVKHVIVLSGHVVAIWPRGIPEGQLFTKRTCICILKKDYSRPRRLLEGGNDLDGLKITTWDILNSSENDANGIKPPKGSFFLYCDKNIIKEDWYFALIRATKVVKDVGSGSTSGSSGTVTPKSLGNAAGELLDPSIFAKSLHFKTPDMINLIQTLYSSEGQFQTKWLNAIIGRIFLGLQKTETLKNYLQMKIEKKLTKINKPGFLDEFQIKKLDVGSSAPYFTYPLLKEISPDGTLVLSANVHYHGQLSVQIATKLLVNLGVRLKQREVDVLLSVTIQKLEGRIIIKIKPPPSERIWYSFETEPTMDLKIEPIVSSRQMTYNIITGTIEKKFKEAIRDSLVLPHWDDFVFYDTTKEIYRGGIWDKLVRPQESDLSSILEAAQANRAEATDDTMSISSSMTDLESVKIDLNQSTTDGLPNGQVKVKLLSSTLNDFSKKIKKNKSISTMSINEENCLSDGSVYKNNNGEYEDENSRYGMSTLKKIGKWYFKDGKQVTDNESSNTTTGISPALTSTNSSGISTGVSGSGVTGAASAAAISAAATALSYKPPEMISNRRQPRKAHTTTDVAEISTAATPTPVTAKIVSRKPSYEMFSKFPDGLTGLPLQQQLPTILGGGVFEDFHQPQIHQPQAISSRNRGNSGSSFRSIDRHAQSPPIDEFLQEEPIFHQEVEGSHPPTLPPRDVPHLFSPDIPLTVDQVQLEHDVDTEPLSEMHETPQQKRVISRPPPPDLPPRETEPLV